MKNKILKVLLPFFPENKELEKHWWHKLAKIVTLIVTITTIYTVLWFVSLIYFTIPASIDQLVSFPTYLPLNFANLFTTFPLYGIIFHKLIYVPYIGFTLLPFLLLVIFYFLPSFIYRLTLLISQNIYRKKVKIIFFAVLLGLGLFVFYLYKYQQLVNEGSYLADERCLIMDPLLAQKKQKILDYTEVYYNSTSSAEAISDASNNMMEYFNSTVITSEPWMKKQREFLNKWDFKFFTDNRLVGVFNAQYDKYMADMNANKAMVGYGKNPAEEKLQQAVMDAVKEQDTTQLILDEKIKIAENRFDIRYYFVKVPNTKCTYIPNPFDKPAPVDNGETRG